MQKKRFSIIVRYQSCRVTHFRANPVHCVCAATPVDIGYIGVTELKPAIVYTSFARKAIFACYTPLVTSWPSWPPDSWSRRTRCCPASMTAARSTASTRQFVAWIRAPRTIAGPRPQRRVMTIQSRSLENAVLIRASAHPDAPPPVVLANCLARQSQLRHY